MVDHPRLAMLRERLRDARSGRVLFVSHCLLNENVRYLGGAGRPAGVIELVEATLDRGVGLVQMPCPEQRTWGGVLKNKMLATYGRGGRWARQDRLRRPVATAATAWTSAKLAPISRRVAADIRDYQRCGMEVVGIVGVGASPSCGVHCTLSLDGALGSVATCPLSALTPAVMNEIVAAHATPGQGIFVAALRRALRRRGVDVPFYEHDLLAELAGSRTLPDGLPAALEGP